MKHLAMVITLVLVACEVPDAGRQLDDEGRELSPMVLPFHVVLDLSGEHSENFESWAFLATEDFNSQFDMELYLVMDTGTYLDEPEPGEVTVVVAPVPSSITDHVDDLEGPNAWAAGGSHLWTRDGEIIRAETYIDPGVLDAGANYFRVVFQHELAHVVCGLADDQHTVNRNSLMDERVRVGAELTDQDHAICAEGVLP